MTLTELQRALAASGRYPGAIDGRWGPITAAAVTLAMEDGPDTKLTAADYAASAVRLSLTPAHVIAVTTVESPVSGFADGKPTILPEPHVFSRLTQHGYDSSAPDVSWPRWDRSRYPKTQALRWKQLLKMISLNVDAGFMSASYGRFQILGLNFMVCGYRRPFEFAVAMARDEQSQLMAFERYVLSYHLDDALRRNDWRTFSLRFNGPAAEQQNYPDKLAKAFAAANRV